MLHCPACDIALTRGKRACRICAANRLLNSARGRRWLLAAVATLAVAVGGLAFCAWQLRTPAADLKAKVLPAAQAAVNRPDPAMPPAGPVVDIAAAVPVGLNELPPQQVLQKKKPKGGKLAKGQPPPGWSANYDASLAEAKLTRKPLFVVFRCER